MIAGLLLLAAPLYAADVGWTLAGVYDASAVRLIDGAPEKRGDWAWKPSAGLTDSCGPAKAPDGLGVPEAQAIASSLTPTLALLLRRTRDNVPALDTRALRVAVGRDAPLALLRPAVEPRFLTVDISGDSTVRARQLVRTQLEMELCMEHKTGRGWAGARRRELREAFLLSEPTADSPADEMYFRGQRSPVPPLLGAPDACLVDSSRAWIGKDPSSSRLALVPSDVWSASLRPCAADRGEVASTPVAAPPPTLPLAFGDYRLSAPVWEALEVRLSGTEEDQVEVDVQFRGASVLPSTASRKLFSHSAENVDGESRDTLIDILAQAPYRYPTLGSPDDPGRYVLLLVPGWQLDAARAAIEGPELPTPADGVGWILEHPEMLYVQVRPPNDGPEWPDLAEAMIGRENALLDWGFTVGSLEGRGPVPLPGDLDASWKQVLEAQRGESQSAFLAGIAVLATLLWLGIRRLPDLWTTVPEERVDYWPGEAAEEAAPDGKSTAGELLGTEE
jgi:hypothetical protein